MGFLIGLVIGYALSHFQARIVAAIKAQFRP